MSDVIDIHNAGPADLERAAAAAARDFDAYRSTTPAQRAAFLHRIASEIDALGDALVQQVTAETGIPVARATGELARTTGQLRLFASVVRAGEWTQARLDTPDPQRTPLPKPDLRQRSVPLGPVAVFAASNFPLAFSVAGGDTASALAAGAPVIVKAHPAHPRTSRLVGDAVRRAVAAENLPEGTFSVLLSSGPEIGVSLVQDPRIGAVGFTGSRRAGLALVATAAARPVPIPVFAEMSSVNPVFVLPGALAERAALIGRDLVASMLTGVGQLCTSPGLVFVADTADADTFLAAAADAVSTGPTGPMLTTGIAQAFGEHSARAAAVDGVQILAHGESSTQPCGGRPQLLMTTADRFLAEPVLAEEVFGPSSLIVRTPVDRFADVVAGLEGQLTATVHAAADDHPQARELVRRLELVAGRLVFNGWPTGVEVGHATVHGGPHPATSAASTTSVGSRAIERFLRPVAYQNLPEELFPEEIQKANVWSVPQRVDGKLLT
ncbi:2,5-dioxovalerate dehydrogenase [Mycolicibacterium murale]|uniref:2,5-dioxovalerate dehydrogenase n=1 Tax=Mycolicibacterium murale TaxID=182220 RepID=A0A7I9WW31_9MYCO|nr:aldehyde dehydrogenase (NADP(+)) [Mycolicibacterium murale]MCV7180952.1 aldehyde dehydrogenase (NADP(+)) [Mycolicibacterium murale]GFG61924.1 2,5-dioxovalerate dehydrogenase [Mycolicibacterium murale]